MKASTIIDQPDCTPSWVLDVLTRAEISWEKDSPFVTPTRDLPKKVVRLIELAGRLDEMSWRIETAHRLLEEGEYASFTKLRAQCEALRAGDEFWLIAKTTPAESRVKLERGEVLSLKEEAANAAREAWDNLPSGTVLAGKTIRTWHHGCPHAQGSRYRWEVYSRRGDGFQYGEAAWFRLLADGGVHNHDNGRDRAVWFDPDKWEVELVDEIIHKKGAVLMQVDNLKKIAGEYPEARVIARRK